MEFRGNLFDAARSAAIHTASAITESLDERHDVLADPPAGAAAVVIEPAQDEDIGAAVLVHPSEDCLIEAKINTNEMMSETHRIPSAKDTKISPLPA